MRRRRDPIERGLETWLERRGLGSMSVEPLAGDVSRRRYFRLREPRGKRRIVAYYPPDLRPAQVRFSAAAELLESIGVRVPRRFEEDLDAGFSLIEDLGDRTLAERHDLDPAPWFERAFQIGERIAALSAQDVVGLGSPPLDAALLERELGRTIEVFLAPRGLASESLVAALGQLCRELGSEPAAPCHRDLMARNLVPLDEDQLAVIDFQDLRLGPPAYDAASLLNDTLFAPEPVERNLVGRLQARGVRLESYRRAVVQRTLKAVGTFVAFARSGDSRHLPLVGPSLERAARHLSVLPETSDAFAEVAARFAAPPAPGPLLD